MEGVDAVGVGGLYWQDTNSFYPLSPAMNFDDIQTNLPSASAVADMVLQRPVRDASLGTGMGIPQANNASPEESNLLGLFATGLAQPGQSSANDDPIPDTESEIIERIRAKIKQGTPINCDDSKLIRQDPWVTYEKGWFFTGSGMCDSPVDTESGYWKETQIEVIHDEKLGHNRYIGLRRSLEFYMKDDTETDWLLKEYISLRMIGGDYIIEEGSVAYFLRKRHPCINYNTSGNLTGYPDGDVLHNNSASQATAPDNDTPLLKHRAPLLKRQRNGDVGNSPR